MDKIAILGHAGGDVIKPRGGGSTGERDTTQTKGDTTQTKGDTIHTKGDTTQTKGDTTQTKGPSRHCSTSVHMYTQENSWTMLISKGQL